ncbi:hypothetical protein [Pararcticibacter amylolyticus]|uniref:Uncharacterized protein n=1 Tax=Pararcticibacter amylolyticus TaxID=2173175 RepID=A0A2U2PHN2_9SPHI|nr:hypothetical protein [Pararcticibacter amylolyticus]PWG80916.1 hypothetical protein DDR33_10050 [Pararcticibacter amylolyticus]
METKAKNNGQANVNTVKADKTPKFVAGNPVNAVSKAEEAKPQEQAKLEEVKPQAETPTGEAPKAEPTKKEIKFQLEQEKPALNLEQTLKKIKDLSRLSNQREKLLSTIEDLDAFEVKQLDDAEETNLNHFQRCELKITDDNGNTFSTKNPFIINEVATNIKALCEGKLAEVEAQISLTL